MKATFPLLFFTLTCSIQNFAQEVEHNFEMEPQKTNCAEIQLEHLSEEEKIVVVEQAVFRYTQDFKLNRMEGFQAAWYYSCDTQTGFVITKVDKQKNLYLNIPKELWERFVTSGDFMTFILNNFKNRE